jgi:hypothetical protein
LPLSEQDLTHRLLRKVFKLSVARYCEIRLACHTVLTRHQRDATIRISAAKSCT